MIGSGEGLLGRFGIGKKRADVSDMVEELRATQTAAQAEPASSIAAPYNELGQEMDKLKAQGLHPDQQVEASVEEPVGDERDIAGEIKVLDETPGETGDQAAVAETAGDERDVAGEISILDEEATDVQQADVGGAVAEAPVFDTQGHKQDVLSSVKGALDRQKAQREGGQAEAEEPVETKPSVREKYADVLADSELSPEELDKVLAVLEKLDSKIETAENNLEQKVEVAQQALEEVAEADAEVVAATDENAVFIELEAEAEEAEDTGDVEIATQNRSIFAKLAKYRRVGGRLTRKGREAGSQRREQQALDRIQQKARSVGVRKRTWFGALRDVVVGLANTAWQPVGASADSVSAVGAAGDYMLNRVQRLGVDAKDMALGAGADVLSNKVAQMIENAGSRRTSSR